MPRRASHLRQYRKATFLAQRELATLVGLATQQALSELESGAKRPGLEVAIACAVALGVPLTDLFPRLAADVQNEMLNRACALYEELASARARREAAVYLAALIERLGNHQST